MTDINIIIDNVAIGIVMDIDSFGRVDSTVGMLVVNFIVTLVVNFIVFIIVGVVDVVVFIMVGVVDVVTVVIIFVMVVVFDIINLVSTGDVRTTFDKMFF